jgi:hypothetical protein
MINSEECGRNGHGLYLKLSLPGGTEENYESSVTNRIVSLRARIRTLYLLHMKQWNQALQRDDHWLSPAVSYDKPSVAMIALTFLQGDQKVTQPILKYLLMVANQYNSSGLINTQYRCDYTRAHAGHVML